MPKRLAAYPAAPSTNTNQGSPHFYNNWSLMCPEGLTTSMDERTRRAHPLHDRGRRIRLTEAALRAFLRSRMRRPVAAAAARASACAAGRHATTPTPSPELRPREASASSSTIALRSRASVTSARNARRALARSSFGACEGTVPWGNARGPRGSTPCGAGSRKAALSAGATEPAAAARDARALLRSCIRAAAFACRSLGGLPGSGASAVSLSGRQLRSTCESAAPAPTLPRSPCIALARARRVPRAFRRAASRAAHAARERSSWSGGRPMGG